MKISNAEQNRIYEEEKRRVWDLQAKALSNPVPPELDVQDEDRPAASQSLGRGFGSRSESRRAMSRGHSMAATPFGESPREMSPSQYSVDGESHFTGNPYGGKVLRIKRIVSTHPVKVWTMLTQCRSREKSNSRLSETRRSFRLTSNEWKKGRSWIS